jgi:hypothetical protein
MLRNTFETEERLRWHANKDLGKEVFVFCHSFCCITTVRGCRSTEVVRISSLRGIKTRYRRTWIAFIWF